MKKSLLIGMALLSLGALSCTREQEAPVQKPADSKVVTLGAVLEQKTKAAISDAAVFTWQAGDAISVDTTEGLIDFELTDGEGQSTASFSGTVTGGEAALGLTAIYPAGAHKVTADGITVNLPAEYTFIEDNTNIPLVGTIADGTVTFKGVGGVARIKAGAPIGAVKAVLATDKKITGDFTVAEDKIVAGEGEDAVVYTFPEVTAETNMTFNFPLPTGEYTMSFCFLDKNNEPLAELPGSAPHTINAADVLIFDELAFPELPVKLNDTQEFGFIQDAVNAAASLTEGSANITLGEGVYDEIVKINEIGVPVVIDGSDPTLACVKAFEIRKSEVTIKNLTIKPSGTATPSLEDVPSGYNYPFGSYVYYANYGVTYDNIILDMSEADGNATGLFFINNGDKGSKRDAILNSVLGAKDATYSKRNAQIYGEAIDIVGNIIAGGHRDYGIRIGNVGVDAYIANNEFFNSNPTANASGKGYGIDFYSLSGSNIVLESNTCDDSFNSLYGASATDVTDAQYENTFVPALVYDGGKLIEKPTTLKDFAAEFVKGLEVWENTVGTVDADGKHNTGNGNAWENVHFIPVIPNSGCPYLNNPGNNFDQSVYTPWVLNVNGQEISSSQAWEIAIRGLLNLVTEEGEEFLAGMTDRNKAYNLADNGKLSDAMPSATEGNKWGNTPWYEYDDTVKDNGEEIEEVDVNFIVKVGAWHVVRSFIPAGSNNPLGMIGNFQQFGTETSTLILGNYVGLIAPMRELLILMRIYKYILDNNIEENVYTSIKDEKFDFDLYGIVEEPLVSLNGEAYETIQAAVNAAAELTSGTAVITLKDGAAFTEEVKITGNSEDKDLAENLLPAVKVPVIIDGGSTATTLTGSIEVSRVPVTIKNLTVTSTETSTLTLEGTYTNSAWTTAIHSSVGGYGLTVEGVVINPGVTNATGIWLASKEAAGGTPDLITGCTFNNPQRAIQAYATDVSIIDNTFNDYTANIIRIGNDAASFGAKYIIKGNTFTSSGNAINFYNIDNSKVWIAADNGVNSGNDFGSAKMTANVTLTEKNNVIIPALAQDGTTVTIAEEAGPLTRVWAKWNAFDNSWDDEICDPSANNWDRHAAIVGQFLYVPSASRTDTKVAVFDVLTGELVYTITEGFNAEYGLFKLCSIAKLGDAIYVSSMSNSGQLAIYKLTDMSRGIYTKATLARAIDVPAGERFGDEMTSVGTDANGSLIFISYSVAGARDAGTENALTRTIWEFFVTDGVVEESPRLPARGVTAGGNFIGGLYIYEYSGDAQGHLTGGSYSERHGFYASNVGGTGYIAGLWESIDSWGTGYPSILEMNVMAPKFLTIDGQKYFMYVSAPSKTGYLRVVPISGENYKAGFESLIDVTDLDAISTVYPLVIPGNKAGVGPVGTNGTGFCDYTTINGETYVVAGATENGWSCFKF